MNQLRDSKYISGFHFSCLHLFIRLDVNVGSVSMCTNKIVSFERILSLLDIIKTSWIEVLVSMPNHACFGLVFKSTKNILLLQVSL